MCIRDSIWPGGSSPPPGTRNTLWQGDAMIPNKDLIFDIYEKVNGRSDSDWVEIAQEHGLDISTETLDVYKRQGCCRID